MRHLNRDEERLLDAIRTRISDSKTCQITDAVIAEVARMVSVLTCSNTPIVERVGPVCSTADLVEWMGISRQAINKALKENRIFGVRRGRGSWMYPTWQFTPDYQVLPGLPPVVGRLDGVADCLEVGAWFITANKQLDGLSPAEWLQAEQPVDAVIQAAEHFARQQRH